MEKVVVTARIDGQTEQQLRKVAKREDRSVSYLVRKAVERYVGARVVEGVAAPDLPAREGRV